MKKYIIQGWNHLCNASGYLPEVYDTKEAAEQGVKDNSWIMDDYIINEVEK